MPQFAGNILTQKMAWGEGESEANWDTFTPRILHVPPQSKNIQADSIVSGRILQLNAPGSIALYHA